MTSRNLRAPRTCAEPTCPRLVTPPRSRCTDHEIKYTRAEQNRVREIVLDWIDTYGPLCEGYEREPHYVNEDELTGDHVVPLLYGGRGGAIRILCRSCNSRRGARPT